MSLPRILPSWSRVFGTALLLAAASACQSTPAVTDPLDELGTHHRAVTTTSAEAQRWFDRGLVLTFAFNHDEAVRCFEKALAADPKCAAAWWGIALCNGPHINYPMVDDVHGERAWKALEQARALSPGASSVEQALIAALGRRYAWPNPPERRALDEAYANAMREVWRAYPKDADVGALCAEALMDLSPWNQWSRDGKPKPGTLEVLETLDAVIALDPRHPLAHHLKVHALEASQAPDQASASADILRTLVPGAGHLVHMPAHIDCRVGRWHDASTSNERAAAVDARYQALHTEQGFYRVYMAHNHHFLAFSCMMEGRSADALAAARALIANMPESWAREHALFVEGFLAIELEVLIRFGRWQALLARPEPPEWQPLNRALRHFARGTAFAALGKLDQARVEERELARTGEFVPKEATVGNNSAHAVLAVAAKVLAGEIAAAGRDWNVAVNALERAIELEDQFAYDEPPDWIMPVRHSLGAVLVRAERFEQAEKVYREDLRWYPENGWSLRGLSASLRGQKRSEEADAVEERFRRAWRYADVEISSSCLCQP